LNISTGTVVTRFRLSVKRFATPSHLGLSMRAWQVRLWQLGVCQRIVAFAPHRKSWAGQLHLKRADRLLVSGCLIR